MKLLGGEWSKGDIIGVLGLVVAVVGVIVTIVPLLPHTPDKPAEPPPVKRVAKSNHSSSGYIAVDSDKSQDGTTPIIYFGKNPQITDEKVTWSNTDNLKTQNQQVQEVRDPTTNQLVGVKAIGTITGKDSQNILGQRNSPGGGHGELDLDVSWTEDAPAQGP